MEVEVIFEKTYPRVDIEEKYAHIEETVVVDPNEPRLTYDEIMQKIYSNMTYILMPERVKASQQFIDLAIEVSDLYGIYIVIRRHLSHISVVLSFDYGGCFSDMCKLLGMADRLCVFNNANGREITFALDYFTHVEMKNGKIMNP